MLIDATIKYHQPVVRFYCVNQRFFYSITGKNNRCFYQQNPLLVWFLAYKEKIQQYESHFFFSYCLPGFIYCNFYADHHFVCEILMPQKISCY